MSQSPSTPARDEEIIRLYFARDEMAITETDRRYGRLCMKLSMDILRSRPDAEECVNDTYLRTWNAIPPTVPDSLCAFLLTITRNLSISRLREIYAEQRGRHLTVPLDELSECLPARDSTDSDLSATLAAFVRTLDETEHRLFLGRYWYNLSVKELAAEWDITPNHATKILKRVRRKLRAYLEKGGYSV